MRSWSATVLTVILALMSAATAHAATVEERADALLAAMTTEQRIALALGDWEAVAPLGVPAIVSTDGPNGVRTTGTTSLPSAQALSATFDRALARAYGELVGEEARGRGFNAWLGPAMDIARTPLAGRLAREPRRRPVPRGDDRRRGGRRREVPARHLDAEALRRQQPGDRADRLLARPDRPGPHPGPGGDRRSAHAQRDLRGAVPPRDRGGRRERRDVLLQPARTARRPARASPVLDRRSSARWRGYVVPDFRFAVRDPLVAANAGVDLPALGGDGGRTAEMFTSGQISPERRDDIVRRILLALLDSGAFDDPLPAAPAEVVRTPGAHARRDARSRRPGWCSSRTSAGRCRSPDARSIAADRPERRGRDVTSTAARPPSRPRRATAISPLDRDHGTRAQTASARPSRRGRSATSRCRTWCRLRRVRGHRAAGRVLRAAAASPAPPVLSRTEPVVDVSETPAGETAALVGALDRHAHPAGDGRYRFSLRAGGIARRDGGRASSSPPAYREAVAVHRRTASIRSRRWSTLTAGEPVPVPRRVRRQEPSCSAPEMRTARGSVRRQSRNPRGGRGGARGRRRRSSSPTPRRARAWTAPRSRCPATRTS